jgi:hypothetical protein
VADVGGAGVTDRPRGTVPAGIAGPAVPEGTRP